MKLCADILYWRLKEELKAVELHGAGSLDLTLSRPESIPTERRRLRKTASTSVLPTIYPHARRSAKMCASSASGSTGI